MPETTQSLPVTGTVAAGSNGMLLMLTERLDGHDTFLTGRLQLADTPPVAVRILTFDDVTVLRLIDQPSTTRTGSWTGTLHLSHGWRSRAVPTDLATAADSARRDLAALDDAERRYALTFLAEASTPSIREARIEAIVTALPTLGSNA